MSLPIFEIFLNEDLTKDHIKVSLVKDPAIELNLLKFNSEDKPLFFANEEKKEIYCVAMRPNKLIFRKNISDYLDTEQSANVFYSSETIEQFQKMYFKNNSNSTVNINHNEKDTNGIYCFESWIVKDKNVDKSKVIGLDTIDGDLVMAFKIDNSEIWEQCKSGDLDGLSIEAYFDKKLINNNQQINMKKEEKTAENLWGILKSFFATDEKEEEEKKVEEMVEESAPAPAPEDDLKAENEALKAEISELKKKLADIEAEKVKAETDLETMKKQTPKVAPIPATPKVEMMVNKSYEQMTNFEKLKFNREN